MTYNVYISCVHRETIHPSHLLPGLLSGLSHCPFPPESWQCAPNWASLPPALSPLGLINSALSRNKADHVTLLPKISDGFPSPLE